MRCLKIIPPLLLLLPFALANAQEPLPWPPDPAEIFAPDIEIVESGIVVQPPDTRPTYDNDARVVRVYDESNGEWREFPYDDEITGFSGVDAYSTPNVLILTTTRNRGVYSTGPDPSGQWLLDTTTGEFSRPELMCGELRAREGEGEWVVYYPEAGSLDVELCHTGSGEELPIDIGHDNLDDSIAVSVSPDGKRAILFGYAGVYVYTFETGAILRLGGVTAWDFRDATWLGNEQVLIYETERGDMMFPWRIYSLGNVTRENSLEQVVSVDKPGYITTLDNPTRFEWVDYRDGNCYLIHMHAATGQRDEYDLQDLCEQGVFLPGTDDRLFTPINMETLSRDLVRFNPYTGERRDLYSGEVEFIMDISADGRYAVIVIDDNDQLDMLTMDEMQYLYAEDDRPIHFQLAIISLETGDLLYETPAEVGSSGSYGDFWYYTYYEDVGRVSDAVAWDMMRTYPDASLFNIGGDRFIFYERGAKASTLIEIADSHVIETSLDRVLLVLRDYLVMAANDRDMPGPLSAYNIITGETTPLISAVTQPDDSGYYVSAGEYSLSLSRGDIPDTLRVNIWNEERRESWRCTIRIPS